MAAAALCLPDRARPRDGSLGSAIALMIHGLGRRLLTDVGAMFLNNPQKDCKTSMTKQAQTNFERINTGWNVNSVLDQAIAAQNAAAAEELPPRRLQVPQSSVKGQVRLLLQVACTNPTRPLTRVATRQLPHRPPHLIQLTAFQTRMTWSWQRLKVSKVRTMTQTCSRTHLWIFMHKNTKNNVCLTMQTNGLAFSCSK